MSIVEKQNCEQHKQVDLMALYTSYNMPQVFIGDNEDKAEKRSNEKKRPKYASFTANNKNGSYYNSFWVFFSCSPYIAFINKQITHIGSWLRIEYM